MDLFPTTKIINQLRINYHLLPYTGADPGFPIGGGADPPGEAPTYEFTKFSQKILHGIENVFGPGGGV